MSEFIYLGCVLNESGIDDVECRRKVAIGKKAASAIRSLVNAWSLHIQCASELHEGLLVPVLLYDSETMTWREKDSSRIMAMQMDNLRGLIGIRRMNRVPSARIRELCGVAKGVDESVIRWFGHIERIENYRIAKSV